MAVRSYSPRPGLLRRAYQRFLRIRGEPREIALGFALGIFVGMTPFMGLHTIIAVFFAALFKWNKISPIVGVMITNWLTAPFIYSVVYFVGYQFVGGSVPFFAPNEYTLTTIVSLFEQAPGVLYTLCVGGVILGLPLSLLAYALSYTALLKYRADVATKVARKKELIKEMIGKKTRRLSHSRPMRAAELLAEAVRRAKKDDAAAEDRGPAGDNSIGEGTHAQSGVQPEGRGG